MQNKQGLQTNLTNEGISVLVPESSGRAIRENRTFT